MQRLEWRCGNKCCRGAVSRWISHILSITTGAVTFSSVVMLMMLLLMMMTMTMRKEMEFGHRSKLQRTRQTPSYWLIDCHQLCRTTHSARTSPVGLIQLYDTSCQSDGQRSFSLAFHNLPYSTALPVSEYIRSCGGQRLILSARVKV